MATDLLSMFRSMKREANMLGGKRILLVEDERVAREALRRLFEQDSHTVVEANNGAEAFALFRSDKFDLVVVDFEMPFVKGNELAARIRTVSPNQPIVMVTGFHKRPGVDNPVDAVVNKPFSSGHIRQVVSRLLSRGKAPVDLQTERIERNQVC
jgi:DNA-binding response OmpR family regulator